MENTTTTYAAPARRSNETQTPRTRGRFYNLAAHVVVAQLLPPGQSVYLTHNLCPKSGMLSAGLTVDDGADFIFSPAHRGREGDRVNASKDVAMAAKLTAMPGKPLLIALHDPWPDFRGGVTVGHIRLARETRCEFDIADHGPAERLMSDFRTRVACKESLKKEHYVLGGPRGAVVYQDERVVPAYWYEEGLKDHLPYTYIVDDQEMEILDQTFRDGNRARFAALEGRAVEIHHMPVGAIRRVVMGPMELGIDTIGMVFGLRFKGEAVARVPLANNVTVYDGKIIDNPKLREALGLRPMGIVNPLTDTILQTASTRSRQMNGLDQAFARIEAETKAKAVPAATRRAKAPKLSDVVKAEAPEEEAPQEEITDNTPSEDVTPPVEPVDPPEAPEPEEDTIDTPPEEVKPPVEIVEEQEAAQTEEDTIDTPPEEVTPPVEIVELEPDGEELLPEAEPAEPTPAVEPHIEPPPAPQDCRAELLVDAWGAKPLPTVVTMAGLIVCSTGQTLTMEIASVLYHNIDAIVPLPAAEEFLMAVYAIQELAEESQAA